MTKYVLLFILLLSHQAFGNTFSKEMRTTLDNYTHLLKNIPEHQDFMATYEIKTPRKDHDLVYYRAVGRVAYYYPQQEITEVYSKMQHDDVSLIRAFDAYKKAIEYESSDITMEHEHNSWQAHQNIVNPKILAHQALPKRDQDYPGIVVYTKRTDNSFTQMIWYEPKKLLLSLEQYKEHQLLYHYKLHKLQKADHHLQAIAQYDTTDFADIGDHEEDPFFIKLINLGFVSHHESNAINTEGKHISIAHSHHM